MRAVGTTDPRRDAAEANRYAAEDAEPPGDPTVFGELLAFDDPEMRLPALDALEEFDPDDPSSPYRRVLIPAFRKSAAPRLAWAYAANEASGRRLPSGRWPHG